MRPSLISLSVFLMAVMAGCHSMTTHTAPDSASSCPPEFQDQLRIAASAVPWKVPEDMAQGQVLNSVLGRRISVSISPKGVAYGMQIAFSELAVAPLGGTFRGWARISSSTQNAGFQAAQVSQQAVVAQASGIDVSPGRLRITPFVRTTKLQPQTLSVDVILSPGAEPLDEMVISAGAFWDTSFHPLAPERIELSLEPLRHYTVYDQVDGIVSSMFVASRPSSSITTTCTAETRVTLVDLASSTPPLWDLRRSAPAGRSEWWLALLDPQTGPHRVIFKNPAEADGFASWLHQTHALRVGRYQVGVFRPGYSSEARRTVPKSHSVTDTFQTASAEDLDALVVGRLGET
jgi:hypothetical protein